MKIRGRTGRTCATIALLFAVAYMDAVQAQPRTAVQVQPLTATPHLDQTKPVEISPHALEGFHAADAVELTIIVNGKGRVKLAGTDCMVGATKESRICKRMLPKNQGIAVEAVAGDGLAFSGWAGDCKGADLSCQLTMNKDTTIAATFQPPVKTTVEIEIAAPGGGSVHPDNLANLPLNCDRKLSAQTSGACTAELSVGTKITLTTTPENEVVFTRWESSVAGCNGPICSFTLQSPTKIRAVFTPPDRTLTVRYRQSKEVNVNLEGKTKGRPIYNYQVTTKPNAAKCTPGDWQKVTGDSGFERHVRDFTCVTQAPKGSNVTVRILDAVHVDFNGNPDKPIQDKEWGGDCAGKGAKGVCTLTLNSNKTVKVCTWQGSPYSICQPD